MERARRWRELGGAALCTSIGYGTPIDVHLFGDHLTSDLGPTALAVGLFAGATVWMFRRWGGDATQDLPAVAEDSDALWAELEHHLDEPTEPADAREPVEL